MLNVSTTCPHPAFIQEGHFLRIPVNDNYSDKLLPYFQDAFQFLGESIYLYYNLSKDIPICDIRVQQRGYITSLGKASKSIHHAKESDFAICVRMQANLTH